MSNKFLLLLFLFSFSTCAVNNVKPIDEIVDIYEQKLCSNHSHKDSLKNCILNLTKGETENSICISELESRSFINSISIDDSFFWRKLEGTYKGGNNISLETKEFVFYSVKYLEWLKNYSLTDDGNWIIDYVKNYEKMKDISPSMIVNFHSIAKHQNLIDKKVRCIILVHYLTLSYNYCD